MDGEGLRLAVHYALLSGALVLIWAAAFRGCRELAGMERETLYRCALWALWFQAAMFWFDRFGWLLPGLVCRPGQW